MARGDGGIRVLGVLGDPDNAVSHVRFRQPFEHLRDRGFELVLPPERLTCVREGERWVLDPDPLEAIDLVMFPQLVASVPLADGRRLDLCGELLRHARRRGIPTVYSCDDLLEQIEPGNPGYDVVRASSASLRSLTEGADAFFVTTGALRDSLARFGRPTFVLPNAIDPARWSPRPRSSGELRVGWSGSSSHVDNLLMVLPAIRLLQRRLPVRLFLLGLVDGPIGPMAREVRRLLPGLDGPRRGRAEAFCELAAALRSIDHVHRPFGTVSEHFRRLATLDLDVGICPLRNRPFERHRSALKFYEYAMVGTMTVASDVTPFSGEVSVTVQDDCLAWTDRLERYLRDEGAREHELRRQRRFVLERRDIRRLRTRWARAIEDVLGDQAPRSKARTVFLSRT